MTRKKETPYCFGKLENVFPLGGDGLRHTPESCLPCLYKTECLRAAVSHGEGLVVHEEKVDRAYAAGAMGFFERWSRKKTLHQKKKGEKRVVETPGRSKKHE